MNEKMCKLVLEHRQQLVPTVFTERQVNLVQKYFYHKKLTPSEQTYFYSAISKKMEALHSLQEEFHVTGEGMIPKRVEEAKQILKEINKPKAFISGSYLYKQKYNDIDIFIVNNRRKSYRQENKHFTFILEKDLHQPIFISAAKYSVANFPAVAKAVLKRGQFDDILFIYQWVINQVLEGEDQKELRDLLLQHSLYVKKEVPDARSLDLKVQEVKALSQEKRIKRINQITQETLVRMYSSRYLYQALSKFIKVVKEMGKEYKTDNIPIFLHFAKEVQYGCRRAQA